MAPAGREGRRVGWGRPVWAVRLDPWSLPPGSLWWQHAILDGTFLLPLPLNVSSTLPMTHPCPPWVCWLCTLRATCPFQGFAACLSLRVTEISKAFPHILPSCFQLLTEHHSEGESAGLPTTSQGAGALTSSWFPPSLASWDSQGGGEKRSEQHPPGSRQPSEEEWRREHRATA